MGAMTYPSFSVIIYAMSIWPVINLDSLLKDLDIFDRKRDPDPGLIRSGLYTPLPVSGHFLIHGFHLLEKAKELGIDGLSVVELPSIEKQELLALCLSCEARAGNYTWPEVERMVDFLEDENTLDKKLVTLIRGHDDPHFNERIKTYRGFSPLLKQLVGNNILDFKTAQSLGGLPDPVFSWFLCNRDNKKFTFSQVRIFLISLDEVARRDCLQEAEIIRICDECLSEKNPVEAIKKRRFPELSGLYKRLKDIAGETVKGTGIQLKEPPYFEGDSFEVRFSFRSRRQLIKRINVLEQLKERADELFELL
jgi:hypothetical protein